VRKDVHITDALTGKSIRLITEGLLASNECFRNSYRKNPEVFKPVIRMIPFHTGLFSDSDSTLKQIYIKK
jgi:hypothetical protein